MSESIGKRIKAKRIEYQMTQNQVAEKLYVTQQTVARWETGKHMPPIKAVQDLSKLFDVNASYFFGEEQVIARHFNFLAFLGGLIFNLLFFGIIAIVLSVILMTSWGLTLGLIASPLVVIWQAIEGIQSFVMTRFLISFVMLIIGAVALPVIYQVTKYIFHILKSYYRYNVNSIVYEVVPRVKTNTSKHEDIQIDSTNNNYEQKQKK